MAAMPGIPRLTEDALSLENAAARAADFLETVPPYPGTFSGRGVVICAGGVRYLTCAWVLIKMLRHLGCELPIEVWYLGEDEGDTNWIDLVRPLGVTCIDAHEVRKRHPHPQLHGWQSKPYAIFHSRFQEVLFLDADNVPVRDPTFLFDEPEYIRTGAVFWPDLFFFIAADNPARESFGLPARCERGQESGQLVIDKQRCWKSLNLCNWYNEHSDFYYRYVYGDKDTFHLAWRFAGQPFAMIPDDFPFAIPWRSCSSISKASDFFNIGWANPNGRWPTIAARRISGTKRLACASFTNSQAAGIHSSTSSETWFSADKAARWICWLSRDSCSSALATTAGPSSLRPTV